MRTAGCERAYRTFEEIVSEVSNSGSIVPY